MKIVKLSFYYNEPIFRQTPQSNGIWGDFKFIIDKNIKECDYWIVYSDFELVLEECICDPENIFFISGEAKFTSVPYCNNFISQFAKFITVQNHLKAKNIIYIQNANPWWVEKNYDEILTFSKPEKTKLISIIASNKVVSKGHRERLKFALKLKDHFGDKLDLFGRGIQTFDSKWDVISNYKFHIAIENDYCDNYVTEKFFDSILANTYPIYYGCPNLEDYIDKNVFSRIDIYNFDKSVEIIENVIQNSEKYELFEKAIIQAKLNYLNELQFFPFLVKLIIDFGKHENKSSKLNTIVSNKSFKTGFYLEKYNYYMKKFFKT